MENEVVGFERIKNLYESNAHFENNMQKCKSVVEGDSCIIFEEYFFRMVIIYPYIFLEI